MEIGTENRLMVKEYRPLVSIITPTYNHERYIEQCIKSVLSQNYTNWEHIIIDDGSTDLTPQIVLKYTHDKRIHYIRQEHMGIWHLGRTYNKALSFAKGELLAILEGDDYWPSDKLEKQVPAFEDPEVIFVWGKGICVNHEGRLISESKPPNSKCFQSKDVFRLLLLRNFLIPTVTVMVRREVLVPNGFIQPRGVPYVDHPTWFELTQHRGKFLFIDEVLGYWRIHSSQVTQKLWCMRKGEVRTYWYLWHKKRIPFLLLVGLTSLSMAKHVYRIIRRRKRDVRGFCA